MTDKLLSLLGICRKANKLSFGFEASAEAIAAKKAALVVLAADISPKTAKEARFLASGSNTEVIEIDATIDGLSQKTGRRAGVLAVTDIGLAAAVRKEHGRVNEED
jgi:ribosomal protein L7Ae-like RNA K-turn-binding protein